MINCIKNDWLDEESNNWEEQYHLSERHRKGKNLKVDQEEHGVSHVYWTFYRNEVENLRVNHVERCPYYHVCKCMYTSISSFEENDKW